MECNRFLRILIEQHLSCRHNLYIHPKHELSCTYKAMKWFNSLPKDWRRILCLNVFDRKFSNLSLKRVPHNIPEFISFRIWYFVILVADNIVCDLFSTCFVFHSILSIYFVYDLDEIFRNEVCYYYDNLPNFRHMLS